jgi:hypothetical protein
MQWPWQIRKKSTAALAKHNNIQPALPEFLLQVTTKIVILSARSKRKVTVRDTAVNS